MNQRNVPGIDNAYLAMDTEEGVEVVWNEVMFSERKNFKLQEVGAEQGQCAKIQLKHRVTVHVTTIDLYVVMVQGLCHLTRQKPVDFSAFCTVFCQFYKQN